ncbi:unnamed protein product [Caenorhabditis nigoni]
MENENSPSGDSPPTTNLQQTSPEAVVLPEGTLRQEAAVHEDLLANLSSGDPLPTEEVAPAGFMADSQTFYGPPGSNVNATGGMDSYGLHATGLNAQLQGGVEPTRSLPTLFDFCSELLPIFNTMATAAHNRLVSEVQKRENDIEAKNRDTQKLILNALENTKDLLEKDRQIVELRAQLTMEQGLRKKDNEVAERQEGILSRQIEEMKNAMKDMKEKHQEDIQARILTQGQIEGELRFLRMAHQESQTNLEAEKRKVEDLQRREVNNRKRHSENLRKLWEDEENRLGIAGDEESHKDEDSSEVSSVPKSMQIFVSSLSEFRISYTHSTSTSFFLSLLSIL